MLRRLYAPPFFDDEAKTRQARILNVILLTLLGGSLPLLLVAGRNNPILGGLLLAADAFMLLSLALMRRGELTLASNAIPVIVIGLVTYACYQGSGVHDIAVFGYFTVIAL